MNNIMLRGTDISTTPIGFGCAGLMRTATSRGRQKLLNAAYDSGIRHFDVARMYGLGQSETELGKFSKNRRDQITITTKFGIDVSQKSRRLAPVISLARRLVKLVPSIRNLAKNRTSSLYQEKHFDVSTARNSLEKSLIELNTDYIDLYMLHEPSLADLEETDVLEFLESSKKKGLIRAYGIAGYTKDCIDICTKKPEFVKVLQVPNDIVERQLEHIKEIYDGAVLTFSPFSNALSRIAGHLKESVDTKNQWNEKVGLDCCSSDNLSKMLLQYCIDSNSDGTVICSTSNVNRISGLVDAVNNEEISNDTMVAFSSLVRQSFT